PPSVGTTDEIVEVADADREMPAAHPHMVGDAIRLDVCGIAVDPQLLRADHVHRPRVALERELERAERMPDRSRTECTLVGAVRREAARHRVDLLSIDGEGVAMEEFADRLAIGEGGVHRVSRRTAGSPRSATSR